MPRNRKAHLASLRYAHWSQVKPSAVAAEGSHVQAKNVLTDALTDIAALLALVTEAESAIGENLVWIGDLADQLVRQKDRTAIARLSQMDATWQKLAKALGEKR